VKGHQCARPYPACYGFSGGTVVTNETKEALAFTSGSGYVIGKLFFSYDTTGFSVSEKIGFEVKLNDEQVVDAVYALETTVLPIYSMEILLPPFTKTEINFITTDLTGINMTMVFTGRVYGAE